MKLHRSKTILIGLLVLITISLLMPAGLLIAQNQSPGPPPLENTEKMSPEEVDRHIAGMSDEQVRQAYAEKLKREAEKQTALNSSSKKKQNINKFISGFHAAARRVSASLKRIGNIFSPSSQKSIQWHNVVEKLSGGKGLFNLLGTLAGLVLIIVLGLISRILFLRTTNNIHTSLIGTMQLGKLQFWSRVLSRIMLDAVGIGVYFLVTFIFFVLIYRQGNPSYDIVSAYLIISYYVMVFNFSARVIFSPKAASLRLFPLEQEDAVFMYKWIVRIVFLVGIVAGASNILRNFGVDRQLYLMVFSSSGEIVMLALIVMIWQSRKRVGRAIWSEKNDKAAGRHSLRAAFSRNWHYFAILYVLVTGGTWVAKALNEEAVGVVKLILSIFLVPIVIGIDQWVQRLLQIASGEHRETIDLSGDEQLDRKEPAVEADKMNLVHYLPMIKRFFRIFLIAFLFFVSLRLWGIDLLLGRIFTQGILKILTIILLSFIVWQLVKTRIDQKLKEEIPEDDGDKEEGGAGGSRMGTLLVLLRKFVFTVLFVLVSLTILSSLGVNIGPLIAGAGVIGLAIGFGAQTLVKDIIAGVFFLIDDAFRVGDYIAVGGTTGTVEHISLRSLRLRSPRGPVHTIPFGSMGTVTNNSRDYVITKLDFRVRYDTDVNKVRKIIKKINNLIQADEVMGPSMLDKVKSQGIRELDDSAMVMRLKFKTIPGEQFVIRREVFRMIQEAFRENGIEFAHRNVTVYMPPNEETNDQDKTKLEAGAAAALAANQAEEAQKTQKK